MKCVKSCRIFKEKCNTNLKPLNIVRRKLSKVPGQFLKRRTEKSVDKETNVEVNHLIRLGWILWARVWKIYKKN